MSCILSKFYIKPQRVVIIDTPLKVVSYRNSTSNHNVVLFPLVRLPVVSYRNSTSNHNLKLCLRTTRLLYLIEILHQTTTCGKCEDCLRRCILSKFYIKPQLARTSKKTNKSCILSKFYIKPQRRGWPTLWIGRCILSKFYIKPQLFASVLIALIVVSYRNSTSNHNAYLSIWCSPVLYLIEILHQTTTVAGDDIAMAVLYLIEILHQTTTVERAARKGEQLYLIEILHQTTTVVVSE